MARPIWTGYLSFGLVVLPVALYSATESRDLRFNQFEEETNKRVRYKRVAEDTDREVPYQKIVKGLETATGEYVMLTQEELAAVEPGRSKTIEIGDFVDLADIDPVYFEKTYYLAPRDKDAERPYALLRQAMQNAQRIGIAMFVMRNRQYLAAVRPGDEALVLSTLYYGDEVREPRDAIEHLPGDVEFSDREIGVATSLIEQLTIDWDPGRYKDEYREAVLDLVRAKEEGREVTQVEQKREDSKVVDLAAALERSVAAAKARREKGSDAAPATSRAAAETSGAATTDSEDSGEESKEELYARAQELKIPGRSKMNRDELAAAIARAERKAAS